jgi:hypothetical protein
MFKGTYCNLLKTLVMICVLPSLLSAQTQVSSQGMQPSQPTGRRSVMSSASGASMAFMPMSLVAPLFIEDDTASSVITIVNNSPSALDVDVILSGPSGEQIAKRTVTISPHDQNVVTGTDLLTTCVFSLRRVWVRGAAPPPRLDHGCTVVHRKP